MIPSSFEYFAPKTVQEALGLLSKFPDEAKVLAGGHSLLPQMKLRLATPKYIVDIGRISALSSIKEEGAKLLIGALATHHSLESSALLKEKCPLLSETAAAIGDVQVRNRGTIGGSLVHADPAADWPATILALDAELKLVGPAGERVLKAEDFFVEMLTTALKPNELLTEIRIPQLPPRTGGTYLKMHQKASGFAIVGVAVRLDGRCLTGLSGGWYWHYGRGVETVPSPGGGRRTQGQKARLGGDCDGRPKGVRGTRCFVRPARLVGISFPSRRRLHETCSRSRLGQSEVMSSLI